MVTQYSNETKKDEDVVATSNQIMGDQTYLPSGGGLKSSSANPDVKITVYTASSTWTKPTSFKYIKVELVGGGGNGFQGSTISGGGGGGGGGYSMKIIFPSALGTTEVVTVGGQGATSSFGSHLQATGGSNAISGIGAAPGVGSLGSLNLGGQGGSGGDTASSGVNGGCGGSSQLGGGGLGGGTGTPGGNGSNYGGGGGGGSNYGAGTGAQGVVVVTEYS